MGLEPIISQSQESWCPERADKWGKGQLRDVSGVGLMHRASLSLPSEGPGGQCLFLSSIYLEPSSTEEVGGAWFSVGASLSSMKPASEDEGQGKGLEEKGRDKGESGTAPRSRLPVWHTCVRVPFPPLGEITLPLWALGKELRACTQRKRSANVS